MNAANFVDLKVLYLGLLPGAVGMNLPRSLGRFNFHQSFLGVDDAYISHSGFIKKRYIVSPSTKGFSLEVLAQAIEEIKPTVIIPVDDLAVLTLQKLATTPLGNAKRVNPSLLQLIKRSIGAVDGYGLSNPRAKTYDIARSAGIKVPEQMSVFAVSDIGWFVFEHGYPFVLKRERSMAGDGVHIVHDANQLETLIYQISNQFDPNFSFWVIQKYIPGSLGIHSVYADQGKVLAHISAVQVQAKSDDVTSPSSIVRLVHNPHLEDAANAFVEAASLSGFHGWDFQIDDQKTPVLIEHNPRVISISHLDVRVVASLITAMAQCLGASEIQSLAMPDLQRKHTQDSRIGQEVCLFPFEWHRWSNNPKLTSAQHDVPWNDSKLLKYVVNL